jgi:hypothetical protein
MSDRTAREQLPRRRQRDEDAAGLCDEVSRLAARVASLAQSCHAQSLKPIAVAAKAAVEAATSRAIRAAEKETEVAANAVRQADAAMAAARTNLLTLQQRCAALEAAVSGPDNAPSSRHALEFAPAALRIFRFAADTAPRVLEIAHVSAFLRECAVEFGSADATLPGALCCEFASGRYLKLRFVVERNAARCTWLAEKLLACRSGAPMPAAALAPDVTRHDVNWGAEGARRHAELQLTHDGHGLSSAAESAWRWAHGAVGVTSGKHFFQVRVTNSGRYCHVMVGWVDEKQHPRSVGFKGSEGSGAAYELAGRIWFGTAPLAAHSSIDAPGNVRPYSNGPVGCLLNLDATPARMTVFVDGEPLAVQCDYDFPKDGRAWFPSVCLHDANAALHSCAM